MDPIHSFISAMGNYLEMRGFSLRPVYERTIEVVGSRHLMNEGELYREIGERLAKLHRASAGFPVSKRHPLFRLGKWKEIWLQRLKRIRFFRDSLFRDGIKQPFEALFLTHYTYFAQLGQVSLFYLDDSLYPQVVPISAAYGLLTYRSLSMNDLKIKGNVWFINEEEWRIDIPVRDLGSFIRNTFMEQGDLKGAFSFLNGYQRIREITPEEFPLLYAFLLYPAPWVELVDAYFTQTIPHEEGMKRLRKMIDDEKKRSLFIARLREGLKEEVGIEMAEVKWLLPIGERTPQSEVT